MFLPVGRTTEVDLASSWPSPGFVGAFLPDQHRIDLNGFTARWRAASFGRNVPQAWLDADIAPEQANERLGRGAFGVTLVTPVDIYQQTERSTKYGVLFVLLTFATFFLIEMLQPASVHPVQYLLIGAALCVFYLLLLSLAEQAGFAAAYLVAACATIGLIGTYARHALNSRRSALRVTGMLTGLYAFLYGLLQLEDYALLMGSVVLFAILAGVMFITRRIDWYSVGAAAEGR
jgi:inner membrane protein